jgi:hypothetical protein
LRENGAEAIVDGNFLTQSAQSAQREILRLT